MTPHTFLHDEKLVRTLVAGYDPLNGKKLQQLTRLLDASQDVKNTGAGAHQLINDIVISNYSGELVLKHHLFKHFYRKNVIAAFEMKVSSSRADFVTINGHTKSFEIKSALDNLVKLQKQAADYARVFDYNYVVIDQRHLSGVQETVPASFGIWSFSQKGIKKVHRPATLNTRIEPSLQLALLTQKELRQYFNEAGGIKHRIQHTYNAPEINLRFRAALKRRYERRWNFLIDNHENILPIDIQFFFKRNIDPQLIYS